MADAKLTALDALTGPAVADLLYLVDDVAGTPTGKKVTLGNVYKGLGTGTPDATTYLRGDGAWVTPAGGGDVVGPASSIDNAIPRFDSTTGKLLQGLALYSPTIDDNGTITANPSDLTSYPAYKVNYAAGAFARLFQVECPTGGHGPMEIRALNTDFGQPGPDDFIIAYGVFGDGTTTELNVHSRETGFDEGATGRRSFEVYDTIQHVEPTYWPTSRRVGFCYLSFSDPQDSATGGVLDCALQVDSLVCNTDFANPDNPGVGTIGQYFSLIPRFALGETEMMLSYKTAQFTTTIDPTSVVMSAANPLSMTISAAGGGLTLEGLGANLDMATDSGVAFYGGKLRAPQLSAIRTNSATAFTAAGLDLDYFDPGKVGIWSGFGSDIFIQANSANGVALMLDASKRLKTQADHFIGWVPSTTLHETDIDSGFARAAAGRVKVVSDSSGTLGTMLAGGYYYLLSGTTTNYPMNQSYSRTLPTTVDDYVEIGTFSGANGAENMRVTVTVTTGTFIVSKQYLISSFYGAVGSAYKIVRPVLNSLPYSGGAGDDFELEAVQASTDMILRLRRSVGTAAGTAIVRIEGLGNTAASAFTVSTATGTASPVPTEYFGGVGADNDGNFTSSGKYTAAASTTARSSMNVPSGTAPSSPVNGDIWSDGSNLLVRLGGATYTLDKTSV